MANDHKKEVAEYLRTKFTLPVDAKDDDIIAYARERDPKGLEEITKASYGTYKKEESRSVVGELKAGFMGKAPQDDGIVRGMVNATGDMALPTIAAAPLLPNIPASAAMFGATRAWQLAGREAAQATNDILNPGSDRVTDPRTDLGKVADVVGNTALYAAGEKFVTPVVNAAAGKAKGVAVDAFDKASQKAGELIKPILEKFPASKAIIEAPEKLKSMAQNAAREAKRVAELESYRDRLNTLINFRESYLGGKKISSYTKLGKAAQTDIEVLGKAEKQPLIDIKEEIKIRVDSIPEKVHDDLREAAGALKSDLAGRIGLTDDNKVFRTLNKYSSLGVEPGEINAQGQRVFGKQILNPNEFKTKVSVKEMIDDYTSLGETIEDLKDSGLFDTKQTYALRQFREQLGNKIGSELKESGQSVVADAWKENRAGWTKWFGKWRSDTAVKIQKRNPDKVFDLITSGEVTAEEAKQVLHPNTWQQLKQAKIHDIIVELKNAPKSPNPQRPGGASNFLSEKYTDQYLKNVFDPQEIRYIKEIAKLGDVGDRLNAEFDSLVAGKVGSKTVIEQRRGGGANMGRRAGDFLRSNVGSLTFGASVLGLNELSEYAFGAKIPPKYATLLAGAGFAPQVLAKIYMNGGDVGRKSIAGVFKALNGGSDAAIKAAMFDLKRRAEGDFSEGRGDLGKIKALGKQVGLDLSKLLRNEKEQEQTPGRPKVSVSEFEAGSAANNPRTPEELQDALHRVLRERDQVLAEKARQESLAEQLKKELGEMETQNPWLRNP
jgi:hypothetical protein